MVPRLQRGSLRLMIPDVARLATFFSPLHGEEAIYKHDLTIKSEIKRTTIIQTHLLMSFQVSLSPSFHHKNNFTSMSENGETMSIQRRKIVI
jgi:hypothetical protein